MILHIYCWKISTAITRDWSFIQLHFRKIKIKFQKNQLLIYVSSKINLKNFIFQTKSCLPTSVLIFSTIFQILITKFYVFRTQMCRIIINRK